MKSSVTLSDFQSLLPAHLVAQERVRQWTLEKHLASAALDASLVDFDRPLFEKLFLRYAVKPELISQRYFECPDIGVSDTGDAGPDSEKEARIYPVSPGRLSGSDIGSRTRFYSERAVAKFQEFYAGEREELAHIIHVTCTGYRSPSAAQLLVAKKGWGRSVGITHAYHMGCYAALPAIRIANGLVSERSPRIDVVHTEMCGLHMNAAAHSPEQIVVQSLFADGHIKYSARASGPGVSGLKILEIQEEVIANSDQDMSWAPEVWGLQMNLSREVPAKIATVINEFFYAMARNAQLDPEALLSSAIFAIHPGGPKIINSVQATMGLSDEQTRLSKKVLFERGNMSSATLPHVWQEILKSKPTPGTKVVSFAFGPGLTVFGSIFEVV